MEVNRLFCVKDKVVIITGGGTGIGRMMAEGFVTNGAKVYIASRREASKAAQEIVNSVGGRGFCKGLTADLTKEEDQDQLLDTVAKEQGGKLNVLINNSGTNWAEPLTQYPLEAFDKLFSVNLKAMFSLTRKALPLLEAAATQEDPARVINIGSIAGIRTNLVEHYAYSTSKAAVHHLTEELAAKLGDKFITVNAIAPGPFESKMMKVTLDQARDHIIQNTVLGRIGQPKDMAGVALLLASPAGGYITGAIIVVDGGIIVKAKL